MYQTTISYIKLNCNISITKEPFLSAVVRQKRVPVSQRGRQIHGCHLRYEAALSPHDIVVRTVSPNPVIFNPSRILFNCLKLFDLLEMLPFTLYLLTDGRPSPMRKEAVCPSLSTLLEQISICSDEGF